MHYVKRNEYLCYFLYIARVYICFSAQCSVLVVLFFVEQTGLPSTHAQKIALRYCCVDSICARYHCSVFCCFQTD